VCTGKWRDLRYGTGSVSDLALRNAYIPVAPGGYRSPYRTACRPYKHLQNAINKETFKMKQISWGRAAVSGAIGVIIGLVITCVVNLINPTANLQWSLTAVGFSSFFASFAGYIAGARRKSQ
jgi:hypothetical protein